jgi:outer membrane protein OmpA-like peptidoglycan-associated protein
MPRVPVGRRATGNRPVGAGGVVPSRPASARADREASLLRLEPALESLPDPQRTLGNAAVARMLGEGAEYSLLQRQDAPETEEAASGQQEQEEDEVEVFVAMPVLWFRRNSVQLRQDSQVDSTVHLAYAIAKIREHLAVVGDEGRIVLHGYASVEGTERHNFALSEARANRVRDLLVDAGIPRERIAVSPHGEDRSFPGRSWNRRVEIELQPTVTDIRFREEKIEARPFRMLGPGESEMLARLQYLAQVARGEGTAGRDFAKAVDVFRTSLRGQLNGVLEGDPLPPDVAMVTKALILWSKDPGNVWGEGIWDSTDVTLSAAEYATVPASQNKCNTYVAEVVYRAVRVVHKAHESSDEPGRYFPYRAKEWGDTSVAVPHFRVVVDPQMGDIWSSGTHVGVYLGEYAGKRLYISARDDGDGVFALDEVQQEHGLQIKYIKPGGVYRRYVP